MDIKHRPRRQAEIFSLGGHRHRRRGKILARHADPRQLKEPQLDEIQQNRKGIEKPRAGNAAILVCVERSRFYFDLNSAATVIQAGKQQLTFRYQLTAWYASSSQPHIRHRRDSPGVRPLSLHTKRYSLRCRGWSAAGKLANLRKCVQTAAYRGAVSALASRREQSACAHAFRPDCFAKSWAPPSKDYMPIYT